MDSEFDLKDTCQTPTNVQTEDPSPPPLEHHDKAGYPRNRRLSKNGLTFGSDRNDRQRPVFLPSGPDNNFDVLAKSVKKFHQPSDGEVARAVPHQQRNLRLLHPENLRNLALLHAAALENRVNLQGEQRLQQFLLGIGKARVGEHIPAAFGHASDALLRSLCFGFHLLISAFPYSPAR